MLQSRRVFTKQVGTIAYRSLIHRPVISWFLGGPGRAGLQHLLGDPCLTHVADRLAKANQLKFHPAGRWHLIGLSDTESDLRLEATARLAALHKPRMA
jgi:hypothetical protein